MRNHALVVVALAAATLAGCDKDQQPGSFAVVFDWSVTPAPTPAEYPELWVRGRVERRVDVARAGWTVVAEATPVAYAFTGDTRLTFSAVPNSAQPLLVVVLELAAAQDRASPALFFGESQRFAVGPEQRVTVPVRMQTARAPHLPDGTDPAGDVRVVEALAHDGLVATPRVTLSFVASDASQVQLANDLSFSLNARRAALADLTRDGARYLWVGWDLDAGLCLAPPCADGLRRVYLRLLNDQGYASPVYDAQAVLDTTAPVVRHSAATPRLVKADGRVVLQVALDEPLAVSLSPTASAQRTGGGSLDLGAAEVSGDRLTLTWRHTAAAGDDGDYGLRLAELCDRVDNCHGAPVDGDADGQPLAAFTIDATPPAIVELSTPAARYSAQPGHDELQVTLRADQAPQRFEVWIDELRITDGCVQPGTDAAERRCAHTVVDDGLAPGGTRVVYATVWDAAGNSAGADVPLTYDFEPPVLLSPVIAPAHAGASSTVRVSFSFSEAVTATTLHAEGLAFAGGGDGQNFAYRYPVGGSAADGAHALAVSVEDLVGNALVAAPLGSLQIDATLPGLVDGSAAVAPAAVRLGEAFVVDFTVDEPVLQAPLVLVAGVPVDGCTSVGLAYTCTHRSRAGDLDGFKDLTVGLVDLAENHATLPLGNVEYDTTPPVVIGASILREPFYAPARDGQRTWFSPYDPLTGQPVTARVYVFASERLATALAPQRPTLSALGPGGARLPFSLDSVDETLAVFSLTFEAAPATPYVDGEYQLSVSWTDLVANQTARSLTPRLVLVASTPAHAVDQAQTVYRRFPWGATETGGAPRFSLTGSVGASTTAAHVLVYRTPSGVAGDQIGFAEVDPQRGDFVVDELAGGDLPRVYAVVVDRSGARGALHAVANVQWVATLGRKQAGSLAANPHRFENLVELMPMLLADGTAGVQEVDGSALGAAAAGPAQVAGEAGWRRVRGVDVATPALPSPRHEHAMAYDSARGRLVLFGGETADGVLDDETWEWDGQSWQQLAPRTRPAARRGHSMGYDEAHGRVVLYGGWTQATDWAETWEWDGHDWLQRFPAHDPCWRVHAAMAHDSTRRQLLLFGGLSDEPDRCGQDGAEDRNSETWAWDGVDWTRVASSGPTPRVVAAMTYDRSLQQVVLFGGRHPTSHVYDSETWAWDGARWDLLTTAGPSPRWGAAAVYDGAAGQLLLVGGYASSHPLHLGNFDDTWALDGAAWVSVATAHRPPARHAAAAVYDAARGRVVLFGGNTGTPPGDGQARRDDETWVFDGGDWRALHPDRSPGPRLDHAMTYDTVAEKTLLYGGSTSSTTCDRTTWLWDGDSWQDLPTAASPTGCHLHALAHDTSRGRSVVFGGEYFAGGLSYATTDTWEWDGGDWVMPVGLGKPTTLRQLAMVHDSLRDRNVLYGANLLCSQRQTWSWRLDPGACLPADEACWSQLSTTTLPDTCGMFALAYDEDRDRMVLHGGQTAAGACATDTWEFGVWGQPTCATAGDPCWMRVTPAQPPPAFRHAAMVYDPGRRRTLLFGGDYCPNALAYSDETWEWDGAQWSKLVVVDQPARRQRHAMAYDTGRGKVVLFGGNAGSGRDAETWEFDRDAVLPAQVFRVDLAAASLEDGATVTGLEVRLRSGGVGEVMGSVEPGVRLLVWDTDHWAVKIDHGAPLDQPADLSWSPADLAELDRMRVRDTLHVAVSPLGPNGRGLAELRTDDAELRLRYRLP